MTWLSGFLRDQELYGLPVKITQQEHKLYVMKDSTLDMQFSIIFIPLVSRLPDVMVSPRVSLSLQ